MKAKKNKQDTVKLFGYNIPIVALLFPPIGLLMLFRIALVKLKLL